MTIARNATLNTQIDNKNFLLELYKAYILKSDPMNEQNCTLPNYVFIDPRTQKQDVLALRYMLFSLSYHGTMNYVMCCDLEHEMYWKCVSPFMPKWKLKILGFVPCIYWISKRQKSFFDTSTSYDMAE